MSRFTVTVFCGSSPGFDPVYVEAARAVGTAIGRSGMALVYGGGHVGLMGTVADAALAAGAEVTGIIPRALQAREAVNEDLTELILVDTMHERKMLMADRANAFLALPGGPERSRSSPSSGRGHSSASTTSRWDCSTSTGTSTRCSRSFANMRDRGFTHPRYTDMLVVATEATEALARLRDYVPPARTEASPGAEMTGAMALPVRP